MSIDGKTLIEWGFKPGPWFGKVLPTAREMLTAGSDLNSVREWVAENEPPEVPKIALRDAPLPYDLLVTPENEEEADNVRAVIRHMDVLMKTPTIVAGAVMPDTCPAGSQPGTIPVGGIISTKDAIHPGFHSADVCCSMAISIFERTDHVSKVLDVAMKTTHFGLGKRSASEARRYKDLVTLANGFDKNPFLKGLEDYGIRHFMTQGDGNHFLYVGEMESTGQMAIVTHHGSRGLGAQLYKRGKQVAERYTKNIAPEVPAHNAWIDANSIDGENYWNALQTVRHWTWMNHYAIHDAIAHRLNNRVVDRFWNEHNFVFRKTDGHFYHAKGATPVYPGFAPDTNGISLIPLNMAQPILLATPPKRDDLFSDDRSLGFAPHGAGRNKSRTAHITEMTNEYGDSRGLSPEAIRDIIKRETSGLDVRFYTGIPDISELPSAYKNAYQVASQIKSYNLATIVDRVLPKGSIMAGNSERVFRRR